MRSDLTRAQLLRGGVALGVASAAAPATAMAVRPRRREYWVAAVPATWNLVPNQRDGIHGTRYTAAETTARTVLYRQYTAGWKAPVRRVREEGFLGPTIRARTGDEILVHFKNLDHETGNPHSMHFHGVHYDVSSDGSYIPGFSGPGANVRPGESFTYRLEAGPDSAGAWPYHDHSPSMMDSIAGGLYGALSIHEAGAPLPDREFVVFFGEHHTFMTINGRAFVGNTPVFHARPGHIVQWDVLALGSEFHTFHIHGHRWQGADGTPADTRTLGPAESFAVRFREDRPGTWLYHCHVEQHMSRGMIGLYHVR